jgi:hypothetical protein
MGQKKKKKTHILQPLLKGKEKGLSSQQQIAIAIATAEQEQQRHSSLPRPRFPSLSLSSSSSSSLFLLFSLFLLLLLSFYEIKDPLPLQSLSILIFQKLLLFRFRNKGGFLRLFLPMKI